MMKVAGIVAAALLALLPGTAAAKAQRADLRLPVVVEAATEPASRV